jgi:DNA-directed RNA polymerase subunit alpha
MFQVHCLEFQTKSATELYSKYSLGAFLKGQSITVGNALRRVLLSNLYGISIIGVRISGVNHEFSTIPHVKEDVIDILLNLKQVILKGSINEPVMARLNVQEPGIVTANSIEFSGDICLVEPQQYIACLTKPSKLEMEFLISKGQNYITSDKIDSVLPPGFLAVDAIFMPVRNVNFFVETSRGESSSDLETLILEITTNGSITPAEALSTSAVILENTFGLIKVTETLGSLESNVEALIIVMDPEPFVSILSED